MTLPAEFRSEKNPHAWKFTNRWEDQGDCLVGVPEWHCPLCGERSAVDYAGSERILPTRFGCTALPRPCAPPEPDRSALPRVAEISSREMLAEPAPSLPIPCVEQGESR